MKKVWRLFGIVAILLPFCSSIVSAESLPQPADSAAAKEQIKEKTEESKPSIQLTDSSDKKEMEPPKTSAEEPNSSSEAASATENSTDDNKKEKKPKVSSQNETSGSWGTVPWTFDSTSGTLVLQGGTAGDKWHAPWKNNTFKRGLKKIEIQGNVVLPSDCSSLFEFCLNLESIEQANKLDTSKVVNMSSLFYSCFSLTNLDVNDWDTAKVTDMNSLFYSCFSLTNLDVSNWNTAEVTDMNSMFSGCRSLTALDVSNWDTTEVSDMSSLFAICGSLTNLDVNDWDTAKVTDMNSLFSNCRSLTNLDVSNWITDKVTDISSMFYNCSSLSSLDVSNWITAEVTDMSSLFYNCSSLSSLDVSNWITAEVTDMNSLFSNCRSLSSLDVSNWNTAKVTYMINLFSNCRSLTTLDVSNWITDKVTDISSMFYNCSSLSSLDVSNWNTDKVIFMSSLFCNCTKLNLAKSNVSNWHTDKVSDMRNVFAYCNSLTSLDVSKWNTDKVSDMSSLFSGCLSLTSLDISKWNTDNVSDMNSLFSNCRSLSSLDVSKWNTDKVTNMNNLFSNCSSLSSLDISNWDTAKVTNMNNLFAPCFKLSHIKFGAQFTFIAPETSTILEEPSLLPPYAGKWQKDQQGKAYTSDELEKQYDGSTMAGDYYWARYAAPVTVKYFDENGKRLAPDETINDRYVNDPYDAATLKPKISRIYQVDTEQLPTNEKGKMGEDPITVTYHYKKILDDPGDAGNEGTGSLDSLSLDYVSNFDFGSQKISAENKTYHPAKAEQPHVQVTDQRKNASGWEVQVSISPIQDTDYRVLKGASLLLVKEKVLPTASSSGAEPLTNNITLNSQPQTIFQAKSGQGKGSWINKFDRTKSVLAVPGGAARAKNYKATVNWTLNVGPDN